MYSRIFTPPQDQSYFLFGPRGTGKTSWLKKHYTKSNYIDLLDDEIFNNLTANPKNISTYIQNDRLPIVLDEVQRVPHLLNEVHRLIENKKLKFVLTGSSARKLKKSGTNLLAGRALTYAFHPLTCVELQKDFDLNRAMKYGTLPMSIQSKDPHKYLQSYLSTYLKEEVQQEGLTRNLPAFSRFLQAASFAQASPLNVTAVAADCAVERKVVEDYFSILRDLLLSFELPIFSKKAKRELISKSKFYFFDTGVFRAIRPKGPLDSDADLGGFSLETLVLQNLKALNDYNEWGYEFYYWHTRKHQEVDIVMYGPKKMFAIELKSGGRLRKEDFDSILLFKEDYPMADCLLIYGGTEEKVLNGIKVVPAQQFFNNIENLF
jgi:predicted AAA+ superfamily ATPase